MIPPNAQPALKALQSLHDLARDVHALESARYFGLAWLAAARLVLQGADTHIQRVDDLRDEKTWLHLIEQNLLPLEVLDLLWSTGIRNRRHGELLRSQALGVVVALAAQQPPAQWDVADAEWSIGLGQRPSYREWSLAPELADLLVELLGPSDQGVVWIPFDPSGQLTVRALRRGWRVVAAGPFSERSSMLLRLLVAASNGQDGLQRVQTDLGPETDAASLGRILRPGSVDAVLATPPLGARIAPGQRWSSWPGLGDGGGDFYDPRLRRPLLLDRSESWAVGAFWPYAARRGVFVVAGNVLFGKGQEQQLREWLLRGDRPPRAVATLPPRLLAATAIAPALILAGEHWSASTGVRVVDGSDLVTDDAKSAPRSARVLDTATIVRLLEGASEDPRRATVVPFEEIERRDFNLMPSRYLRGRFSDADRRVPLRELIVDVIRAPVASKDPSAVTVQEAGIPDLDQWRPLVGPFGRTSSLQARKLGPSALRQGDLLVSVKGTVGKSGLIGAVTPVDEAPYRRFAALPPAPVYERLSDAPVVSSQSCIALRPDLAQVLPEYLFLFLRSDDFKRQVEGLRVGSVIAHVTPDVLLQEIQVPLLPRNEQRAYVDRHRELCGLEETVQTARARMDEIRSALWPVEPTTATTP